MAEQSPMHTATTGDDKKDTRVALLVEYSGTKYAGFQLQKNCKTIQGELESALLRLTGRFVRIHGASRTDSGAHASGQVVSFTHATDLSTPTFVSGLNYYLAEDIKIRAARDVELSFNPRYDALARTYEYNVLTTKTPSPLLHYRAFHYPFNVDMSSMQSAAKLLIGTRDFRPFTNVPDDIATIRRIDTLDIDGSDHMLRFTVRGNAFLPRQIRRMVGLLLQVGKGRISLKLFTSFASAENCLQAGPTTPAHGLYLTNVCYPEWESSELTNPFHVAISKQMMSNMERNQEKCEATVC